MLAGYIIWTRAFPWVTDRNSRVCTPCPAMQGSAWVDRYFPSFSGIFIDHKTVTKKVTERRVRQPQSRHFDTSMPGKARGKIPGKASSVWISPIEETDLMSVEEIKR